MSAIKHFLLVFDHRIGELVSYESFGSDALEATRRYGEVEQQFNDCHAIDIVLVGSDSIETVKKTHANYFSGQSARMVHDALNGFALPL